MTTFDTKWGQGPDFAEVAEALGVRTDQVMASGRFGNLWAVLYTPGDEVENPPIYRAVLDRGEDGILIHRSTAEVPGMWTEIRRRMEMK